MNPIKKLASQTVVYGIPSIAARFLNYLLTYLYTRVFSTDQFGVNSEFYAYSGFFAVLLAFGMETGFFRFYTKSDESKRVYSTTLGFIIASSLAFFLLTYFCAQPIANVLRYENHAEYIRWFAMMLAFDAVCAIPFAKLRAENKAGLFAGIKVLEIVLNVSLNIFFLVICRKAHIVNESGFLAGIYNPEIGVGYIFISNLVASAAKMLLLLPQFKYLNAGFDKVLFKKILAYSLPMVLIGFAGIINEMLDRMILKYMLPYDAITNLKQLGIYGACYKLSILMSLFIQAFRFAAEPFFFSHAGKENAQKLYADVMNYFTIFCAFVFLLVMLYLDYFQGFIGKDFREGLKVVPVLLLANMFFGIYVNLSIWYKLSDNTMLGAAVSIGGAVITVVLNLVFIPAYGYIASAWATLACYLFMAVVSYLLGQKYYPVNYNVKKITVYITFSLVLWFFFEKLHDMNIIPAYALATLFMLLFFVVVYVSDGRKLIKGN